MANSLRWQTEIVKIAAKINNKLLKVLPEFSKYLIFNNNNIGIAFSHYNDTILPEIKSEMGIPINTTTDKRIDRHKIISGYTKAFLLYPVFQFDFQSHFQDKGHNNIPLWFRIANYYFCYNFMLVILHSDWKLNGFSLSSEITTPTHISSMASRCQDETTYLDHYYKLLSHFETNINEFPIFSFAHLVFYIEMSSNCIFNGMKRHYFAE